MSLQINDIKNAIINGKTVQGYIHWKLTGERVLGVGEASGMFPIDIDTKNYNADMVKKFDKLIASKNFSWKL
ncbi:hypothetical protein LF65_03594 [Clostridium beijerinckii]|uniref:Uncharacterized protein n=1 Tax=Clostridium beijerinckii TaxID=1520 RepID=A0A0B5QGU0_CLOBE|nr:hypothetical protein LF65_03594 [Clostridium beijerinckii]